MVLFIHRRVCHSIIVSILVPWPWYWKFLIVNGYHLKQVNEINLTNYSKNNEMIFPRNFIPPFDIHVQYTWSVYNFPWHYYWSPQLSTRGIATSKKCKLANSIQIITTTKAGTQLRLIIIDTNNKNCMKLKLEIILYVPGLVRKKRTRALWLYIKLNDA